jgi:trigger factor
MAVIVETLEKLERRITLTLPASAVGAEVEQRLKKLSRTVKADGFRPGKVPMSFVAQRYGDSVQYEVITDKLGLAFAQAAGEAQLRVAGTPRLSQRDGAGDGEIAFDATFEVYPEIKIGDLSAIEVERVSSEVTEDAVDRTVEILRKQRRTFAQRSATDVAADGDRVTIDFEGKIDGEAFQGGKAEGFQFMLGEGQMLEAFERAVRGMKSGESKTFPLTFPDDYHGKDVAGKEADFLVTVRKVEAQHLPEVNDAFAKSLGIKEASVEGLRADVRKNLEREVKFRVLARNKAAAMDALAKTAELDLPKVLIDEEAARLMADFRERLKSQGLKDAENMPLQENMFTPQAERRVRLGLVVGELVRTKDLKAKPEQLQSHIEELSQSYEKPAEVMRWYLTDRQRMQEVEAVVIENNVTTYVLGSVKVTEKVMPFDELMAQAQG